MALSADENLALHDILDVPFFDGTNAAGYNVLDGMGSLTSAATLSGSTQSVAVTSIAAWIAGMGASTLTNLQTLIQSWVALGTSNVEINGGVGSITGLKYSIQGERDIIAKRVRDRCPFYPFLEVQKRRAGVAGTAGQNQLCLMGAR